MTHHKLLNQGFALLMSLIVVSVVVSIGLTVIDLTLKQVRLSTNSKESETAFHAANAALECARYWREENAINFEAGENISISCFGAASVNITPTAIVPDSGTASQYTFESSWGTPIRCSEVKMLLINASPTATSTVTGMSTLILGYPYGNEKKCGPGGRCTVLSARGYSKACTDKGLTGTVQREVLLEL
jgi:Tfp pilus assembly protein PilX